mgnify:CR=1 FL=1
MRIRIRKGMQMNNIGEHKIDVEKLEDEIKYLHGAVNMLESNLDFLGTELLKTKEKAFWAFLFGSLSMMTIVSTVIGSLIEVLFE